MMPEWLDGGMTYQEYYAEVEAYARRDPALCTTDTECVRVRRGPLNLQRMNRIGKTCVPSAETVAEMRKISGPQVWMVLSEPWCGDSAQCVPIIARIAERNPQVRYTLFLRDRHPEIMDRFLTNGTRSIPKLVVFSAEGEVLFQWGPRPGTAMEIVARANAEGVSREEREERLHRWYALNRGAEVESEIMSLVCEYNLSRRGNADGAAGGPSFSASGHPPH
jgi:hypothetical protein